MPWHVILICGITISRDTVERTGVSRLGWTVLSTWSVEGTFAGELLIWSWGGGGSPGRIHF